MSTRQRAEATGKAPAKKADTGVMWRGKRFTLPPASDVPLEALEAEEDGKHLTALRLILGPAQYATFRQLATTAGDVEEFSTAVTEVLGRGNS